MKIKPVTDEEILKEFGDCFTSYSIKEKRQLIAECLIKLFCGYNDSAILIQIITNMNLISHSKTIRKMGKEYLMDYYYRYNSVIG